LLENNSDNLKIVYKNFPLSSHRMSAPAAKGAMAANEQGRFWDFHDKLFSFITSPSKKKLSEQDLGQIPIELGLDMPRYLQNLNDPKVERIINRDLREGQKAGVTGTPSLYINGRKVSNRSVQGVQLMIDQELKKLRGNTAR